MLLSPITGNETQVRYVMEIWFLDVDAVCQDNKACVHRSYIGLGLVS